MTANRRSEIGKLGTEQRNRRAQDLDTKSAREIARIINAEDAKVSAAVKKALPQIAKAIDVIAKALANGGRLIYIGAGTSGRLAALDASEIPPTFNSEPHMVQYVIAGGNAALGAAAEYNEDSEAQGIIDLMERQPTKNDVVVGVAASGRTPYTVAAVRHARNLGAKTVAVVCNPKSALGNAAAIEIVANVGPEVVSGSTRMKAGTAQKMILNMLTTGAMARLGRVYGNLMVNVHVKNEKLRERALGILMEAAKVKREAAERALRDSGDDVSRALIMLAASCSAAQASLALKAAKDNVRAAIRSAQKKRGRG